MQINAIQSSTSFNGVKFKSVADLDLIDGFKDNGKDIKGYFYNNGFEKDDFYQNAGNILYLQFKNNFFEDEDIRKNKVMYLYFPTFIPKRGKFKNSNVKFLYNTDVFLNNDLERFDLIATPAKKTFEELYKKYDMAVFSGRLKEEALYSLKKFEIWHFRLLSEKW